MPSPLRSSTNPREDPSVESGSDLNSPLNGQVNYPANYSGSAILMSNWKMMTARGLFSIAFGLLALTWPVATIYSIALLFGAYALVDGVFAFSLAFRRARHHSPWGLAIFEGIIGIAAGIVTLFYPSLTVIVLLYTIAVWAIATGFLEIYAGIRVRADASSGFLLVVMGALSLALGSLIVYRPIVGGIAVVAMICAYALIFGVTATVLGLRLRAALKARSERVEKIAA